MLQARAAAWAADLIAKCRDRKNKTKKIPILCYSGMSGVAAATALSLALLELNPKFKFRMAYVRKKGEDSHGNSVEHDLEDHTDTEWEKTFLVFVDDFVSSGASRKYVVLNCYGQFCRKKMSDPDTRVGHRFVPTISINYEPSAETNWFEPNFLA
jgi:orotate phosphoribosyltransferase